MIYTISRFSTFILPNSAQRTKAIHDNLLSFLLFRMASGRLLHYVYKVPKRTDTVDFYRTLGMTALRHEEFTEGCEAQVCALLFEFSYF